jgi:Cd2+/Zn2+-exporting ATPase
MEPVMTEAVAKYRVGGMDCAACGTKIQTAVERLPGVTGVDVSVTAGTMSVRHEGDLPKAAIDHAVKWLGYTIAPVTSGPNPTSAGIALAEPRSSDEGRDAHGHHDADEHAGPIDGPWWKTRKAQLTFLCGAALAGAYLVGRLFPDAGHWAFVVALAVGLLPVARRAVVAALSGSPFTIETLMTVAAVGALFIGATQEAATVVLLFLVGELLEGVATGRARASIRSLTDLVPKTARLEENGQTSEVPAVSLRVGATILVRPGDRIPADGAIIEGAGAINEAPVTGESVPKRKGAGDAVFAGTINTDAVLRVRVTAAAADNTIARVVKLVEEAQESKAPTERFIDRFSKVYTPGVMVVAALVAIVPPLVVGASWSEWVYKGLAVLLIGCPCALVISTPAAIAAGLSAGARRGLLLKGGAVLEGLRRIKVVALDKTGTLTEGKPKVTDVVPFGRTEREVLSLAGALETGSSHPLAVAILARAKEAKAPIPPAMASRAIPGRGVGGKVGGKSVLLASAQAANDESQLAPEQQQAINAFNDEGKTVSVLVVDGVPAGLIAMRDEPRPDAKAGLAALRDHGIRTIMLTGDNKRTAEAIASDLGIEARAELLPEDKQNIVRQFQGEGGVVAKVGDGINDAPAIAAADIGIAMGGGTDVALETADAAVLHGRVTDIANMINLSQRVMNNITQNIVASLGLKVVFLVTTIIGVTGLWPAILADTGATVLVTANAMRLLAWKGRS